MVDVKQIINNVKTIGNSDDEHKDGLGKKRAAFSGAMIGIVAGIAIGYTKKWNVALSAIGGGIIGGLIAGILSPRD